MSAILTLRFASDEDLQAFVGQLTDGWGEGFVDINPTNPPDWTDCTVMLTDDDLLDEDYEWSDDTDEDALLWSRNLED